MYRVLYVDDEPGLLEICKMFLENDGTFSVNTAESGVKALDRLKSAQYDAIVSDYQMPGMDGIAFLKRLRSSGNTTPFIIFTGRGREEIVIQALNNGADFYIQKGGDPIAQFAELTHKLRHAIQKKQADSALKKSERDYQQLIESANEVIYVTQDGYLKMINPKAVELSGYSMKELLALPISTFIHPDDLDRTRNWYQRRIAGEDVPCRHVVRLLRKDGLAKWVELNIVPIIWDEHPATLSFVTDITDRMRAEEALKKSETGYRRILENMQDAYVRTDKNGNIAMVNPSAARIFGYPSAEEMIGIPTSSLYHYPDDRKEVLRLLQNTEGITDYTGETLRKDGTTFWVSINAQFIRDEHGQIQGTEAIIRDITERRAAERQIKESEDLYRMIFETTLDGVFITSPDGRYIDFNDGVMRNLGAKSRKEVFATKVIDAYAHPEERQKFLELVRRDGYVRERPIQFRRLDGTVFDAIITIVPQKNPDGTIKAYVGTVRDLSRNQLVGNSVPVELF